jgi:hypothetical protein
MPEMTEPPDDQVTLPVRLFGTPDDRIRFFAGE